MELSICKSCKQVAIADLVSVSMLQAGFTELGFFSA